MKDGGSAIAFEVKERLEAGQKFFDSIKLLSLSANLGDSRSIVTQAVSTIHSKLSSEERLETGITDGMVRVSVGLEHKRIYNRLLNKLEAMNYNSFL